MASFSTTRRPAGTGTRGKVGRTDLPAPGRSAARSPRSIFRGLESDVAAALAGPGWGWHAECGMHVLRMIVGGVFEAFPNCN